MASKKSSEEKMELSISGRWAREDLVFFFSFLTGASDNSDTSLFRDGIALVVFVVCAAVVVPIILSNLLELLLSAVKSVPIISSVFLFSAVVLFSLVLLVSALELMPLMLSVLLISAVSGFVIISAAAVMDTDSGLAIISAVMEELATVLVSVLVVDVTGLTTSCCSFFFPRR